MTAPRPRSIPRSSRAVLPDLSVEEVLLHDHGTLVAIDEVGRGAAAGPVSVGAVLLDGLASIATPPPAGIADSKALSAANRRTLAPLIAAWAPSAVAHATSAEIDEHGIVVALTLAARRALTTLAPAGEMHIGVVLLDGNFDWVNVQPSLLLPTELHGVRSYEVRTVVRGDASCLSLAAASIVAKEARDALMVDAAASHPAYGWSSNKGYLSPAHLAAVREFGLTDEHRRSWTYPI